MEYKGHPITVGVSLVYQGCRALALPVFGQDLDLAITLPTAWLAAWVHGQDRDTMHGFLCLKPQTCTNVR